MHLGQSTCKCQSYDIEYVYEGVVEEYNVKQKKDGPTPTPQKIWSLDTQDSPKLRRGMDGFKWRQKGQ